MHQEAVRRVVTELDGHAAISRRMTRCWREHLPGANLAAERLRYPVQRRHHEVVTF
ncbi:hypothetical protein [Bradyrhizobium sp. URHD0069]|uniref:hypothetical protein n=1 Tax=Bradyrhizobium sp. URHD0069 TaxID=1380355 RepID=UPI0012DDCCEA|nr:hypothetical protein [Bradyrhizobium sp. URHD0069]